ncbi:MAG: hypothetical protein LRZ85_01130 [Alphaproteobacteria bacterium]|nr:hypothetical protein [Alphaproteobacteria bacterium]
MRLAEETIVSGLAPSEISFKRAAELRFAKFKMMEQGLIGDNFSAIALECGSCKACLPLRINLKKFSLTEELAQIKNVNKDLTFSFDFPDSIVLSEKASREYYDLFTRYIRDRHPTSAMSEYDIDDFRAYLFAQNRILSVRDAEGKLVAASSIDVQYEPGLHRAMHFFYAFYDRGSEWIDRRLGTFLSIKGIELAQEQKMEHIYIGAGAKGSAKLGYKFQYPGLETYANGKWESYDPAQHKQGPDHSAWLSQNTITLAQPVTEP